MKLKKVRPVGDDELVHGRGRILIWRGQFMHDDAALKLTFQCRLEHGRCMKGVATLSLNLEPDQQLAKSSPHYSPCRLSLHGINQVIKNSMALFLVHTSP